MTAPTREERERLRALAEEATPGPWEARPNDSDVFDIANVGGPGYSTMAQLCRRADAAFIAAARTAVPALLDDDGEAA